MKTPPESPLTRVRSFRAPSEGLDLLIFKSSVSLLTASLLCVWEHLVKVGTGDYSLQVNTGSLLFWFPFCTGHWLVTLRSKCKAASEAFWWGWTKANLSEHLVAMGGNRSPHPWSLFPESYDPQLILRCEFLPLCGFTFLAMISLMPGLVLKGTLCAMVVCDCLLTISLLCSLEQVPWPLWASVSLQKEQIGWKWEFS